VLSPTNEICAYEKDLRSRKMIKKTISKKIERNPDPPVGGEGSPYYEAHYSCTPGFDKDIQKQLCRVGHL